MGGDVLIQNAAMVLPSGIAEGDLRIKSGIIKTIAPNGGLDHHPGELIIDATGLYMLPGAIDPHVHFRDPGNPEKEDLESGSRAAAAGGITSFLDMPNTVPNATSRAELEFKIQLAARKTVTNHGFFIGATSSNVQEMRSVEGMDGVCGIKVFMGSSTGDLLVHEQKHLEDIFANTGGVIATHAEDEDRLQSRIPQFKHREDLSLIHI